MIIFSNVSTCLFLISLICVWSYLTPYYVYNYKLIPLLNITPFLTSNKYTHLLSSATWSPLFKRSSYIGLVWKSQWKL